MVLSPSVQSPVLTGRDPVKNHNIKMRERFREKMLKNSVKVGDYFETLMFCSKQVYNDCMLFFRVPEFKGHPSVVCEAQFKNPEDGAFKIYLGLAPGSFIVGSGVQGQLTIFGEDHRYVEKATY